MNMFYRKQVITLYLMVLFGIFNQVRAQVGSEDGLWLHNYETALAQSRSTGNPILLSFAGSDWCKPCIKMTREVFDQEEFQNYASENLVMVLLDFPRLKKNRLPKEQIKHNEQLAEKYNKNGAFPLVVILDAKGNVIAQTGYLEGGPDRFIDFLDQKLKK